MAWVLAGERNSATPECYEETKHQYPHRNFSTKGVKAKCIKLGIDVHADSYRVVRQVDNATPQPAQKIRPEDFPGWAEKQKEFAEEVYSCYEAGPFGYPLHRKLEALGIHNVVIRPQNWDELHKGVKTDKTDALALVTRLTLYVQGNLKALAVVRVPTPEQELARSQSRHREQLMEHRLRLEAQGRSLLLYNDCRVKGRWWQGKPWASLGQRVSPELLAILTVTRDLVITLQRQLDAATQALEQAAKPQPVGVGALTSQVLEREVLDWNRFNNRRQVGSMTGMCPGVRSSGNTTRSGPITKHGNPRLRKALVELSWRLVRFQPDYPPVKRRLAVLTSAKAAAGPKEGHRGGGTPSGHRPVADKYQALHPRTSGPSLR